MIVPVVQAATLIAVEAVPLVIVAVMKVLVGCLVKKSDKNTITIIDTLNVKVSTGVCLVAF